MSTRASLAWIFVLALGLRALAAWWIGPGNFGPDGAGATAAVALGGHPYPLHPLLIQAFGGARVLSVIAGAAAAAAAGAMGQRLCDSPWGAGLVAACAPLLVYPSALAGGDAPAVGVACLGIALAWRGHPLAGAFLAALSLGIKPIALPLLPLLLVTPALSERPGRCAAKLVAGAALGALPFLGTLAPLLRPRPGGGLLGTWWLSTDGAPPPPGAWPGAIGRGIGLLWEVPTWAGHPVLGGLAAAGALWPGPRRRARLLTGALGLRGLLSCATLLGDRLDPRYLGPPSVALAVLAGCALRRAPSVALALTWPALAVVSQVSEVRAAEERATLRPVVPWPGVGAEGLYMDGGVCGGDELRTLAAELATLPPGAEVAVLRLRDGREGELRWPLAAARPDLRITVVHAGCCGGEDCLRRLLDYDPAALVAPADLTDCRTPVIDPGEAALIDALALPDPGARFVVRRGQGPSRGRDACAAMRGPPAP